MDRHEWNPPCYVGYTMKQPSMNSSLVFLALLFAPFAFGDPLPIVFSDIRSGSIGSGILRDSAFPWLFDSDTTPHSTYERAALFRRTGAGARSLTRDQDVFVNRGEDDVGIRIQDPPDFVTFGNLAFASYRLSNDIRPIGGRPSDFAELLPIGDHQHLSLKSVGDPTVTADVAQVPEPSMLMLTGLAVACLVIAKLRHNPPPMSS